MPLIRESSLSQCNVWSRNVSEHPHISLVSSNPEWPSGAAAVLKNAKLNV